MEEVPPGACETRGCDAGVSTHTSRCCCRWFKICWKSSQPRMSVAAPPGAPRGTTGTISFGLADISKQTVELPPGACWCRGAAAGVSTARDLWACLSRKSAWESSPPRTIVAGPPTGPRSAMDCWSEPCARTPSVARQIVVSPPTGPLIAGTSLACMSDGSNIMAALPPGACENRGTADGVSTGASRSSCNCLNTSLLSSLPSMMCPGPPTGPRVASTTTLSSPGCP
mmetsp:Transcript_18024/g.35355  ORF Transcript_18024/g.35355 Transcript_18024/m.35355 type:complete len:227 (-) Transcript_18024:897-1577(-)